MPITFIFIYITVKCVKKYIANEKLAIWKQKQLSETLANKYLDEI